MPQIPTQLLESVVYLYPSEESAEKGESFGGTGFIVDTPVHLDGLLSRFDPSRDGLRFRYFVTNRHVVDGARGVPAHVVRANTEEGSVCIRTDPEDWVFDPAYDVAVCQFSDATIPVPSYGRIRIELFVDREGYSSRVSTGDDVFYIGRFIAHESASRGSGHQRNTPTVRFGNISMLPHEPIPMDGGPAQLAYLVEARSLSGYSGSPVFVYQPEIETDFADEDDFRSISVDIDLVTEIRLLGVDCGHIESERTGNSGMMVVVPSQRIVDLLNREDVREMRMTEHAEWVKRDQR